LLLKAALIKVSDYRLLGASGFIFSNSSHVGRRSGLPDIILEVNRPRTIPPKFGLNWPSGFRGEDFLVIVDGWMQSDDKSSPDPKKGQVS
jgi:hypothetical protein